MVPAGYPEYELRSGGAEVLVGAHNVLEYCDAVTDAVLRSGVQLQLQAFRWAACHQLHLAFVYVCL